MEKIVACMNDELRNTLDKVMSTTDRIVQRVAMLEEKLSEYRKHLFILLLIEVSSMFAIALALLLVILATR